MDKVKCPIAGCTHVFAYGILGWDSHVDCKSNHPSWHPRLEGEHRRKRFQQEFLAFFDQALTPGRKSDRPPAVRHQSGFQVKAGARPLAAKKAG